MMTEAHSENGRGVPLDFRSFGRLAEGIRPHEAVLDEVYLKYARCDPFMPITHFVDHATMGSEALVGLGLGARVAEWISHHGFRGYDPPCRGLSMPSDWEQALGRADCHGDWIEQLERELREQPFQEVLARWVPRFAHQIDAFLFHGVIRTAHAVRALEHKDTPARRGELASGLALWAIGVKNPLPARSPANGSPDYRAEILNYARIGAAAFIHEPTIPKLHWVTGPMAYRLIADHLDGNAHRVALSSLAKTHLRASHDFKSFEADARRAPLAPLTADELEALATQRDAHPIKLTEAALRAHRETGDDLFLRAIGKIPSLHSVRGLLGIAKAVVLGRPA